MPGILCFLLKIPQKNVISFEMTRLFHFGYNKKILATFINPSLNIMAPKYNSSFSCKCMLNISNGALLSLFNMPKRSFRTSVILYEEQDVIVPEFPESVSEGDVRWNKKVGDIVVTDEVVCEIETDKTAIPVPAPGNGVIVARYVEDGGTIKPHQKIFRIKLGKADGPVSKPAAQPMPKEAASSPSKVPPPPPPKATPTPVKVPPLPKVASPSPSRPSAPAVLPTVPIGTATVKVPPQDPTREISGTRREGHGKRKATAKQCAAANLMKVIIARQKRGKLNQDLKPLTIDQLELAIMLMSEFLPFDEDLDNLSQEEYQRSPIYTPILNTPGNYIRCKALGLNAVGYGKTKDVAKRMSAKLILDKYHELREQKKKDQKLKRTAKPENIIEKSPSIQVNVINS